MTEYLGRLWMVFERIIARRPILSYILGRLEQLVLVLSLLRSQTH